MADALRPWTIDFHVAQNDGTVKGRVRTTRPAATACRRPQRQARHRARRRRWMRDDDGTPASLRAHLLGRLHVPQRVMMNPQTWNDVLRTMIAVRDAHGWD
jgi:hypothetical protein